MKRETLTENLLRTGHCGNVPKMLALTRQLAECIKYLSFTLSMILIAIINFVFDPD